MRRRQFVLSLTVTWAGHPRPLRSLVAKATLCPTTRLLSRLIRLITRKHTSCPNSIASVDDAPHSSGVSALSIRKWWRYQLRYACRHYSQVTFAPRAGRESSPMITFLLWSYVGVTLCASFAFYCACRAAARADKIQKLTGLPKQKRPEAVGHDCSQKQPNRRAGPQLPPTETGLTQLGNSYRQSYALRRYSSSCRITTPKRPAR